MAIRSSTERAGGRFYLGEAKTFPEDQAADAGAKAAELAYKQAVQDGKVQIKRLIEEA
jgi:hypothetical protein